MSQTSKKNKAVIINIYGVPGSGKSTAAAYIFSKLKDEGFNVELVTEFAKGKVWEGNTKVFQNQAYVFGKQFYSISRVEDEVEAIITDSPLLLSTLYNNDELLGEDFNKLVRKVATSYTTINYCLTRVKKYNPHGRHQTEEESNKLEAPLIEILDKAGVEYTKIPGAIKNYDTIVKEIGDVLLSRRDKL